MAMYWTGEAHQLIRNAEGAVILHGAVHKACEALPPRTGVQQKWYRLSLYAFVKNYATRGVATHSGGRSEGVVKVGIDRVYLWREQYQRDEISDPRSVLQAVADMKVGIAMETPWVWLGPKSRWPSPTITWE